MFLGPGHLCSIGREGHFQGPGPAQQDTRVFPISVVGLQHGLRGRVGFAGPLGLHQEEPVSVGREADALGAAPGMSPGHHVMDLSLAIGGGDFQAHPQLIGRIVAPKRGAGASQPGQLGPIGTPGDPQVLCGSPAHSGLLSSAQFVDAHIALAVIVPGGVGDTGTVRAPARGDHPGVAGGDGFGLGFFDSLHPQAPKSLEQHLLSIGGEGGPADKPGGDLVCSGHRLGVAHKAGDFV